MKSIFYIFQILQRNFDIKKESYAVSKCYDQASSLFPSYIKYKNKQEISLNKMIPENVIKSTSIRQPTTSPSNSILKNKQYLEAWGPQKRAPQLNAL